MSTLLTYALSSRPFPLQASPAEGTPRSASLMVVATNATQVAATLEGVAVRLPIGDGATQLTADGRGIDAVAPLNWKRSEPSYPDGHIEFVFEPDAGFGLLAPNQSLEFNFYNIAVNRSTGTAAILIAEGSAGSPEVTKQITKFPSNSGDISFSAEPLLVAYGGRTTLKWSGPPGATYSIQYYTPETGVVVVPAPGEPPLGNSGQCASAALHQLTIFTLLIDQVINGQPYHAQTQVIVSVRIPAPVIRRLSVLPSAYIDASRPVPDMKLEWETENASLLQIAGVADITGDAVRAGSRQITPVGTRKYHMTAHGVAGYAGPPVTAERWVSFVMPTSSGFCQLLTAPPDGWVIGGVAGHEVFRLKENSYIHGLDYRNMNRWLEVAPGVQVAGFGHTQEANRPGYEQVVSAAYGTSVPNGGVWKMIQHERGIYQDPENLGATWGVKFADGYYALIWYASCEHRGDDTYEIGYREWAHNFQWILYRDSASRTDPDDGGGGSSSDDDDTSATGTHTPQPAP